MNWLQIQSWLRRRCEAWPSVGLLVALALAVNYPLGHAEENVYLTEVPDYHWYAGCYGTCCGNLIGYWDRHGFPLPWSNTASWEMARRPTAGFPSPSRRP